MSDFENNSELDGIDYESVSSDIGKDLGFSSGVSADPQTNEPPAGAQVLPSSTPAPVPEAWEGLPKAWKKDMETHWGSLTPDVRRYVHEREKQALDGIMHYKSQYDNWEKAYAPVKSYYDQNKMNPLDAFQKLSMADYALRTAPEEAKMQYLQQLINDYQLGPLAQRIWGGQQQQGQQMPANDPRIGHVANRLAQLEQARATEQARAQETAQKQMEKVVEDFINDPVNKYAGEVVQDMVNLIQGGVATDLKSAYEQAIYLNPAVRQKVMAAQMEDLRKTPAKPPKVVRSSNTAPTPTGKKAGSIEETLNDVYDSIQSR